MDYRTDNNPKGVNFILEKLGEHTPEYLTSKQADASPSKFAWRGHFPYSTPKETWMSYAYLKSASTQGEDVKTFVSKILKLAAARFEISEDLEDIDRILSDFKKEASVPTVTRKYALVIERNGEQHNVYPINNTTEVQNSLHHLNNASGVPIEMVKAASIKLVEAAQEFGIPRASIPDKIWQMGVQRLPDFNKAASVAAHRARYVKDAEIAKLYCEIVKSAAVDTPDQVNRYVELFLDLDRAEGIDTYSKGLIDPYTAFYSGPEVDEFEKLASENVFVANTLIPTEAFLNTKQYVRALFSKKAAANVLDLMEKHKHSSADLSDALSRLPLSTQRDLARLAVEHT